MKFNDQYFFTYGYGKCSVANNVCTFQSRLPALFKTLCG